MPFINPNAVGSVAGIVGAGGNVGAMLIGFLFKSMPYADAFFYLGMGVFAVGIIILVYRLISKQEEKQKLLLRCRPRSRVGKSESPEERPVGG
ncbi:hypothetical protein [Paraflavitalea speifideaquila]|uniref:hypothetical protein n=1 Tax=Paraflavitalea speifideaquila TaxID=3076558 RepID=UPI0028EB2E7D|nr:hypothetical protein [Paraflavitalea speifideiaquila]